MTATEFKDDEDEPVTAVWTSETYNVTGVVVGAGGDMCTYDYSPDGTFPQEDTVETCDGPAGNSGAASLGMTDTVVSLLTGAADRISSLLPLQAGGSVVPLALLLSGTAIGWRRGR
ncbi:hypothetical protein HWV07_10650 [Natronomonas salina]|uniref:hypothetical protein n=1 Tax=Natronomonas salina TaxID=1710540 RepID=UPI0015B3F264|nr:hypothetical protein [Natronomonas salina]QLD89463.1 hypothetical protein HWV07_10650 [Natronomonas salina]